VTNRLWRTTKGVLSVLGTLNERACEERMIDMDFDEDTRGRIHRSM